MFDLALTSNYEVQCHALSILKEQTMEATAQELRDAYSKLNAYQAPDHMNRDDIKLFLNELRVVLSRLDQNKSPD